MNPSTMEVVYQHAVAEYPSESCGVIYIRKGRELYAPCRNVAEKPDGHFVMHHEDYANAAERGEIIALVHSHPNEADTPSQGDRVACEETGLQWIIVSVAGPQRIGDLPHVFSSTAFVPVGYTAPLVGRQFVHGLLDCYTIIQDWYKRILDVELPDFEREDDWWFKGQNLYLENFEKAGFVNMPYEDITKFDFRIGDVILMQLRAPVANHSAVYVGDGKIIQHVAGKLSTQDIYGGYWQSITRAVVRRIP